MGLIWPKLLVPPVATGIEYVGRKHSGKSGSTSATSTQDLTSLSGGIGTTALENDLVVAFFATASTANRALSITDGTTDYTLIDSELYADDGEDVNLRVAYKVMGGTPDTSVTFGPTGNNSEGGVTGCYVFRGVDTTTPLDVTPTSATGINSRLINPPSITPVTTGAWILCIGAASVTTSSDSYSSSDLTNFSGVSSFPETYEPRTGVGTKTDWTSGAFDCSVFSYTGSDSTNHAWAAITIALRPA